ncbi:MAG: hypothetical protein JXQ65_15390 [Candidatus Marinimicrobia bacterium]|nr:hypothetical protein [Candidatus Neomarinimicrobiota bacterium]
MKKFIYFCVVVLIALLLSACQIAMEKNNSHPPELLEFLKIEKNKVSTFQIQDLFFSQTYDLTFSPNENIKIVYDRPSGGLKLEPADGFFGLSLIEFTHNGNSNVLPVIVKQKEAVVMKLKPSQPSQRIFVMGSFNTWDRRSLEMKDDNNDGIFTRTLHLDDGVYEYQFVTDQGEFPDPDNPVKVDNGYGAYNSLLKVKSSLKTRVPNLYVVPGEDDYQLKYIIDSETEENIKVHILMNNNILDSKYYTINEDTITINTALFADHGKIKVFRLVATYGNYPGNIVTTWTRNGKILKNNDFIWQDATIYSMMTDRFKNGNTKNDQPVIHSGLADQANFQGGDFQGIIQQIKSMYFQKIGVNTLWITPVNTTTDSAYREYPEPQRYYTGYHGYWPAKPREVEPRLGTMQELQQLVNTAHQHNIKILLDFVSNHTHIEHPYFKNHRSWYGNLELPDGRRNIRLFDEYRLTTWFDEFLPSFDFDNDSAVQAITNDAIWWLKESGADGFRHDATKHVPLNVWRNITQKIYQQVEPGKPVPCFQIGETFGSAELIKSYVNNGMLDSQFNFELFFTQRRVFAEANSDLRDLQMSLDKSLEVYGYNHLMGNIFDSHDQTRMMAYLEGDLKLSDNAFEAAWKEEKIQVDDPETLQKQQALMTFLHTIPGIPIIYYGDEFGMTGAQDPDNRRKMRFDNELKEKEKDQLAWNSKIFNLRKKYSALRRGDYLPLYCDANVMIFSRGDHKNRLVIAINKSDEKKSVTLEFPKWMPSQLAEILVKNSKYEKQKFDLAPYSGSVWKVSY